MFHRGEGAPYNPYPEEGYERREEASPRGDHHGHHGHHHEEPVGLGHGAPPPPPPPPQAYGYGGGQYEEERRPPFRHGEYEEERRPGAYEEGSRRGSQYPPGQHDIQMSPYPEGPYGSGRRDTDAPGDYGSAPYHNSPYAPSPNSPYAPAPQHRPLQHAEDGPPRPHIPGQRVRLFCKAAPDYHLAVVPRQGAVMVRANPSDPHQVWIKDETMSTRVTDATGAHAFALINSSTGQALKHAPKDLEQCLLMDDYGPNTRDESVLWTQSEDMGEGYHCIRMANKITSNLDVLRGDKKSGGVKEGAPLILFAWKKQENQIWKIIPACKELSYVQIQEVATLCNQGFTKLLNLVHWAKMQKEAVSNILSPIAESFELKLHIQTADTCKSSLDIL